MDRYWFERGLPEPSLSEVQYDELMRQAATRAAYGVTWRCAALIERVDNPCSRVAAVRVKVVCAHEHLYESYLCDAHRDMTVSGCWSCIMSKQPHAQCPSKIVEPQELNQEVEPLTLPENVADANKFIRRLVSDAIPQAQEWTITGADPIQDLKDAVKAMWAEYPPYRPEETIRVTVTRPKTP